MVLRRVESATPDGSHRGERRTRRLIVMSSVLAGVTLACAAASYVAPLRHAHIASTQTHAVFSIRACAPAPSRSEVRKLQKAVRNLKHGFITLKLPGNAATRYAEALVERGISRQEQLATLTAADMNACNMKAEHRALLKAASAVFSSITEEPLPPPLLTMDLVGDRDDSTTAASAADSDAPPDEDVGEDETATVVVTGALDGKRLDAALAALLPPLSRTYFGALCTEGRVSVDGARTCKKSTKVAAGSSLRVHLRAAAELAVTAEPIDLSVLYEDDYMIAVDKPSGMVVHPAPGHWSGTFANALVYHVQQQQQQQPSLGGAVADDNMVTDSPLPDAFGDGLRPGIVHRLDRYTTGVLLGAKTSEAQRALLEAFASRRVHKVYLAITAGVPEVEVTTIEAAIGRHPIDRVKMAVLDGQGGAGAGGSGGAGGGGRPSLSVVHRLATDGKLALVAVRIGTGRTHQIRVHLQHLRCPVLGDPLYGDASRNKLEARRASRPLLHAHRLALEHPVLDTDGSRLKLSAPPPEDLRAVAARLVGCEEADLDDWLKPRLDAALEGTSEMFEELVKKYIA